MFPLKGPKGIIDYMGTRIISALQSGGLGEQPCRHQRLSEIDPRPLFRVLDEFGIVLLLAAYDKTEKDDMPARYRKAYREFIESQKAIFSSRTVQ